MIKLFQLNYLAHLYLSGNDPDVVIGNFIADHLKGSLRKSYSGKIAKGIELHHFIDRFTDSHPVVERSKSRLRPVMNKYTPVVVDVYYDHFLAKNWADFSDININDFVDHVFMILEENKNLLPERTTFVMKYMLDQRWLTGYADLDQLDVIFGNMSRRTKFENKMKQAVHFLRNDYRLYEIEFAEFFNLLKAECHHFKFNV